MNGKSKDENIPLPRLFSRFTSFQLTLSLRWTAVYSESMGLGKTFTTLCTTVALCLMCLGFVFFQLRLTSEDFLAVVTGETTTIVSTFRILERTNLETKNFGFLCVSR